MSPERTPEDRLVTEVFLSTFRVAALVLAAGDELTSTAWLTSAAGRCTAPSHSPSAR
jgi:hypothetical protein